jgi:hypothetical protein
VLLQGDLDDLAFAEKVGGDKQLATEVIHALFAHPAYEVPKDEVLDGKTMIFIKKLSTIQALNKAKEDLMVEVTTSAQRPARAMTEIPLRCACSG